MKTIDIQKDLVVSREWLEDFIKQSNNSFRSVALKKVIENSTPLSKVAEKVWAASEKNTKDAFQHLKNNKDWVAAKQGFLKSKIEIDGK